MVGTLTEQDEQRLAVVRELRAMGASEVTFGPLRVVFAADNREHASVDQGELIALKAENEGLRIQLKRYEED